MHGRMGAVDAMVEWYCFPHVGVWYLEGLLVRSLRGDSLTCAIVTEEEGVRVANLAHLHFLNGRRKSLEYCAVETICIIESSIGGNARYVSSEASKGVMCLR